MKTWISVVSAAALSAACSASAPEARAVTVTSAAVRSISNDEAQADFGQMIDTLRGMWGAQERKERRYGFSFDELATDYASKVAAASDEREYASLFNQFLAELKDAHISLSSPVEADEQDQFALPLAFMPIEDTYVVYATAANSGDDTPAFARGDELLGIDGVPAAKLVEQFSIYDGLPNPRTLQHVGALHVTNRESYMTRALQDGDPAVLKLRKPNGDELEVTVKWSVAPHQLPPTRLPSYDVPGEAPVAMSSAGAQVTAAELQSFGASLPFFLTPEVKAQYAVEPVVVSQDAIDKFHVNEEVAKSGKYLAFRYSYCGKTLLLLRLPDFVPYDLPDASDDVDVLESINYLRALLADQAPLVDGLIVDDTHNPGGSIAMVDRLVALLADHPIHALVQEMDADRSWIAAYLTQAQKIRNSSKEQNPARAVELEGYAHEVDVAYSGGQPLTSPLPYPSQNDENLETLAADDAHWSKPFVMLTDELSASGGDAAPLLVQANQLGVLFGQTTVGAGGNVEGGILAYTGLQFGVSRGLFTAYDPSGAYPESRFVEDQGVTPDIVYSHTLADFRAGYVGYVAAFSDALLAELDHHHHHGH